MEGYKKTPRNDGQKDLSALSGKRCVGLSLKTSGTLISIGQVNLQKLTEIGL